MLVLARQRDETIMIGDDVEVTIVDVRGDKVRLGINAPRHVAVHRKEVYELIRNENRSAAQVRPGDLPSNMSPKPPAMRIARMDAGPVPSPSSKPATVVNDAVRGLLRAAADEARAGLAAGGLPIGSILVRDGQIIARGHNQRVQRGDPMAHAEINCLTNAGRQRTYKDTVLYSTLMPCYLCSGAVVQFGIPRVIVGESANFPGGPEFMRRHGVEVIDLADHECTAMMAGFIRQHPELWNEDIGK